MPSRAILLLAVLLVSRPCLAAGAATPLLIESLEGRVTAKEIESFRAFALEQPLPKDNTRNNLVYGSSAQVAQMLATLYRITGDPVLLRRLVEFSDRILAVRNDPQTGDLYWTGRREPVWPSAEARAGGVTYKVTVVESGAIMEHLAACAQLIVERKDLWNRPAAANDPHGYGATCIERARTYIRECNRTIDAFILPWSVRKVDEKTLRLHFPDAPEFKRLEGRPGQDAGNPIPWNQQFMLARCLVRLAVAIEMLGEDPSRVALYDTIVRSTVDGFIHDLRKVEVKGETAYLWAYGPGDVQLRHPENAGHAACDVWGLWLCRRSGRYGVPDAVLRGVAATAALVMRKDGQFTRYVDGSGDLRGLSSEWLYLALERPELYAPIASGLVRRTGDPRIVRILELKYIRTHPPTPGAAGGF